MNECGTGGEAGTFYWIDGDTEEQYQQNLAIHHDALKRHGWLNAEERISYTVDQYGFRETRMDRTKPGEIMAFGCSFTFGLGLPIEHTWPYMLEQRYKTTYNLGAPGMGNETFFRLAYHWIPKIKPEIVCILSPGLDRRERITYAQTYGGTLKLWKPLGSWCQIDNEIDMAYMNEDECFYSNMRAILGIKALCTEYGAQFIYMDSRDIMFGPDEHATSARDLIHPGKEYMQKVANKFYNKIQKKQWSTQGDIYDRTSNT